MSRRSRPGPVQPGRSLGRVSSASNYALFRRRDAASHFIATSLDNRSANKLRPKPLCVTSHVRPRTVISVCVCVCVVNTCIADRHHSNQRRLPRQNVAAAVSNKTTSSVIAEWPRDALRQLKPCQLLHNCTKKIALEKERLAIGEWPWRTLKVIGNGAIRQTIILLPIGGPY